MRNKLYQKSSFCLEANCIEKPVIKPYFPLSLYHIGFLPLKIYWFLDVTVADQVLITKEGKGHLPTIKCLFNNTLQARGTCCKKHVTGSCLSYHILKALNQKILFSLNRIQNPPLIPEDASSMWVVPSQNQESQQ